MRIVDLLNKKSILLNQVIESKSDLIDTLIDLAMKSGKIISRSEVQKAILAREAIMSTGIGKNIALPHAKTNYVNDTVCSLVTLKTPLEYDALDGEPVRLALMIIGREDNVGNHLRLLSKISRILNDDDFRENLITISDIDEVISILNATESDD